MVVDVIVNEERWVDRWSHDGVTMLGVTLVSRKLHEQTMLRSYNSANQRRGWAH